MLDMMTRNRTDMSGSLPCFDADTMGRTTHKLERLTHYIREHGHEAWAVGPDMIEVTSTETTRHVEGAAWSRKTREVIPANTSAVRSWLGY